MVFIFVLIFDLIYKMITTFTLNFVKHLAFYEEIHRIFRFFTNNCLIITQNFMHLFLILVFQLHFRLDFNLISQFLSQLIIKLSFRLIYLLLNIKHLFVCK